jgi:hypothetical protein
MPNFVSDPVTQQTPHQLPDTGGIINCRKINGTFID